VCVCVSVLAISVDVGPSKLAASLL